MTRLGLEPGTYGLRSDREVGVSSPNVLRNRVIRRQYAQ
jgi:hypothetical protein